MSIAEDAIRGPGQLIPKFIRDPLISVRNTETLNRLELMASGGAGLGAGLSKARTGS